MAHHPHAAFRAFATLLLAIACAAPGRAQVKLDFEGLKNLEAIGDYYNGGYGGEGSGPGPNYGITFSPNALAVIDSDDGGSGNFGGEPSPSTALFFRTGAAATLNHAAGFESHFSVWYSAFVQTGTIRIYDGLNGSGNLLATLDLPLTPDTGAPDPTGRYSPFVPVGVTFLGTARSVDFGGTADRIAFDDVVLGGGPPAVIPEPGTLALLGAGALGLLRRKRRAVWVGG